MVLDDVVYSFLATKATRTREMYEYYYDLLGGFLKQSPLNATESDIRNFAGYLMAKKGQRRRRGNYETLGALYIHQILTKLRRIYAILLRNRMVDSNPVPDDLIQEFARRKFIKHPTRMVPFINVKRIIEAPGQATAHGLRDSALLAILFNTAARQGEVRHLKLEDLCKTEKGTWYVHYKVTKSGKARKPALSEWALDYVFRHLAQRIAQGAKKDDLLFVSLYRRGPCQLASSYVGQLFKKYCAQVGLDPDHYSPHCARATAISKHLADGATYRSAMELSGHSSIRMIELYDKRRWEIDNHPGKKLEY